MKFKGFTLAEVLITMAIIGVIASMTLPALNTNMLKHQAGTGLTKGMNEIQQATMLLLKEQDARSLSRIGISNNGDISTADANHPQCIQENFLRCISKQAGTNRTAGIEFTTTTTIPTYRIFDLTSTYFVPNNSTAYIGKDGITYIYNGDEGTTMYYYLLDINGNKGPNVMGRDTFKIGVTRKGDVVAVGSAAWQRARGSLDAPSWQTRCANNVRPAGNGEDCSGAIADNGGEVRYKF